MGRIKWFNAVRAYGLFLVLGYHLFYDIFPGGFLGVDIFFTFSGFLVTAIAIEEVRKRRDFNLLRFYKRRAIRIVIPLFFSVVFTLPLLLLVSPDFSVGIARQTAAAFGFVTNWVQIQAGGAYEAQLLPSIYIHTWSLAIEMQFYLTWGLVCASIAALSKKIFNKDENRRINGFRVIIAVISGTLALSSYMYMDNLFHTGRSFDFIYFNTFSRFFPFLIGSFAASIWGIDESENIPLHSRYVPRRNKLITIALIAVTVLAAAFILYESTQFRYTDEFIFHYGFLLTSLVTVILIQATHGLHRMTPPEMNEPRALTSVADMSYNAYLFHWPFYVVLSALIINNTAASFATLALTFVFSALIFYKAERIFTPKGRMLDIRHRRNTATIIFIAAAVSVLAGGSVMLRAPAITSIEADFAVNNVISDTIGIERLGNNVNVEPALTRPEPRHPDTTPQPSSSQTPEPPPESPPPSSPELLPESPVPTPLPSSEPSSESPPQSPLPELRPSPSPEPSEITGRMTLIGDSVPLGAQTTMLRLIPDSKVDAVVARPVSAGHGILSTMQQNGTLNEFVILALGTNGTNNYEKLFNQMIETLQPGYRLIVVTPFDGRNNENSKLTNRTAEWMRGLPEKHDFITIADWNSLISTQVELLAGDKVHMGGQTSMNLYAEMIADAMRVAAQRPAKN